MHHLYAAGFNAWNQLNFDQDQSNAPDETPKDLHTFTQVLEADTIERPIARLSFTIVKKDGALLSSGIGHELFSSRLDEVKCIAQTATGLTLIAPKSAPELNSLKQFASLTAASVSPDEPTTTWKCAMAPKQIVAFNTGYEVLFEGGAVQTLGDPRYEDCLGREVTPESPAEAPGRVKDLETIDDPIIHVAAGGYVVAALTTGGSLYAWGRPGFESRGCQALPDLNGIPNYVEVDGDKDVKDVAFGDTHGLALTTDGVVYVIGNNSNGQLGFSTTNTPHLNTWTSLNFETPAGHKVVAVAAGPKSSFIITSES